MSMSFPSKIQFAIRNMMRNRRRSLMTMTSVIVGVLALSLFEGYFTNVYQTLEDQAIIGERLGHITLAKKGFFDKSAMDSQGYTFSAEELQKVEEVLKEFPEITLVSPRFNISGLISNGEASRIFIGEGINAQDDSILRGEKYKDLPGKLDATAENSGVIGKKLADQLALKVGDTAVLMGSTSTGMVNAIDVEVSEVFNTGSVGTDDKFVLINYEMAKQLYQDDGAERVVVLFNEKLLIETLMPKITQAVAQTGIEVQAKTWNELSLYYGQVKTVFDMMYLFISVVVVLVVFAGVINTMSMSISERTREIGTLRSLGMRQYDLKTLFVYEGVVIVFIGCLIGVALTYVFGGIINMSDIRYTPPDASTDVELILTLIPENLFGTVFTLTVLAALAAWLPAKKAANKSIVGALTHV